MFKLDVDDHSDLAMQYGVMGVPTLILFVNGQPAQRLTGYQPKDRIIAKFASHRSSDFSPSDCAPGANCPGAFSISDNRGTIHLRIILQLRYILHNVSISRNLRNLWTQFLTRNRT